MRAQTGFQMWRKGLTAAEKPQRKKGKFCGEAESALYDRFAALPEEEKERFANRASDTVAIALHNRRLVAGSAARLAISDAPGSAVNDASRESASSSSAWAVIPSAMVPYEPHRQINVANEWLAVKESRYVEEHIVQRRGEEAAGEDMSSFHARPRAGISMF